MTTRAKIMGGSHLHDVRCTCGQLLAKLSPSAIEVKCGRCKRIVSIPFSQIHDWDTVPAHLNHQQRRSSSGAGPDEPTGDTGGLSR